MKIILISLIIGFLASCSDTRRTVSAPSADNSPSPAATNGGLPPMSYEKMAPELARLSQQAGIPNLKSLNLSDSQTELRLWKAFGLAYPSCFSLKIYNGGPTASFVSLKVVQNKAVINKGNPVYVNISLNAPHSGWPNFLEYLKQKGIDSSINLVLDKEYHPYPDAEALILEMKTGAHHTMAHYIDSTVTDDGKKAFAVCERIQKDFDIQLACKL